VDPFAAIRASFFRETYVTRRAAKLMIGTKDDRLK